MQFHVDNDRRLSNSAKKAREERAKSQAPQSWYKSVIGRWYDSGASPEIPSPIIDEPVPELQPVQLTPEQREFLFSAVSPGPSHRIQMTQHSPSAVNLRLRFNLREGSLLLVPINATFDDADQPSLALSCIRFENLRATFDRRFAPGSFKLKLSLGALLLDDMTKSQTSPVHLIAPKQDSHLVSSQSRLLLTEDAIESQPAEESFPRVASSLSVNVLTSPIFSISVEAKPLDVLADIKVRVVAQPLEIMIVPDIFLKILKFVKPQASSTSHAESIRDLERHTEYYVQFGHQIKKRDAVVDAIIDISAPQVRKITFMVI